MFRHEGDFKFAIPKFLFQRQRWLCRNRNGIGVTAAVAIFEWVVVAEDGPVAGP